MKNRIFKWIVIPIILAAVILSIFFWDSILLQIAPKVVLTSAISDVFAQLEDRFREDPLLIIVKSIDPDGKYTADMNLGTTNKYLGAVNYDLDVQTNGKEHQIYATGTATTMEKEMALSVYLDNEFMAVSSNDLIKNSYYGITYDTFREDIRSIPLLSFFISDAILTQWNTDIQNIQEKMDADYVLPQVPAYAKGDLKKLLLGVLTLPCEIESSSISLNDTYLACKAISYCASGKQVDELLAGTAYAENAEITVTFYLYGSNLVKIQFKCTSETQNVVYGLVLGEKPLEGLLQMQGSVSRDGSHDTFVLCVDTQHSEDCYTESWSYQTSSKGSSTAGSVSFDYTLSTGVTKLFFNDSTEEICLTLTETENGLQCESNDFAKLIQQVSKNKDGDIPEPIFGSMTIRKGSQIEKPEYKNLNQWSLEDFWSLLIGIGSLANIEIGF